MMNFEIFTSQTVLFSAPWAPNHGAFFLPGHDIHLVDRRVPHVGHLGTSSKAWDQSAMV
jgi:hypothetical protein